MGENPEELRIRQASSVWKGFEVKTQVRVSAEVKTYIAIKGYPNPILTAILLFSSSEGMCHVLCLGHGFHLNNSQENIKEKLKRQAEV